MNQTERLLKAKIPCAETGIDVKHTLCDICCPSFHCGIDAYVKDGKVVKIEGTADHPVNHGLLCPKGLSNRQYIYREDRIRLCAVWESEARESLNPFLGTKPIVKSPAV